MEVQSPGIEPVCIWTASTVSGSFMCSVPLLVQVVCFVILLSYLFTLDMTHFFQMYSFVAVDDDLLPIECILCYSEIS